MFPVPASVLESPATSLPDDSFPKVDGNMFWFSGLLAQAGFYREA
jgi:hypothetical protein